MTSGDVIYVTVQDFDRIRAETYAAVFAGVLVKLHAVGTDIVSVVEDAKEAAELAASVVGERLQMTESFPRVNRVSKPKRSV